MYLYITILISYLNICLNRIYKKKYLQIAKKDHMVINVMKSVDTVGTMAFVFISMEHV